MRNKKKATMIAIVAMLLVYFIGVRPILVDCDNSRHVEDTEETEKTKPVGPAFCADSAYAFVKAQCDFGTRQMNSEGHERCAQWIVSKFEQYQCKVTTQKAQLKGYDGTMLNATNIMAQYRPELSTRILLCAHWDSRPWADNDPDSANWRKPILAANDAASGVAVMIEIARLLNVEQLPANLGIDFVCFDAEDWGTPLWYEGEDPGDTWALGAQYWAQNLPQGYEARYGILLDMVGGQGAQFYQEGLSKQFAPEIVKKVWRAARQAGYGSYFPKKDGGSITDDHLPVNQHANIPTIDIIPYYPDCPQSSFGPTWHTLDDNLEHIDPSTLKAVGQTVVQTLWTEMAED